MLRVCVLIALVLVAVNTAGCTVLSTDPRNAPWDPRHPNQMFDQIPAWQGGALRQCCGWRTDCDELKLNRRC